MEQTVETVTETITFHGMVRDKREFKWGGFFLLEELKGHMYYQCVVRGLEEFGNLLSESYVMVEGSMQNAKINKPGVFPDREILVSSIKVITEPTESPGINIYENVMRAEQKTAFDARQFTLRSTRNKAIFMTQHHIQKIFRGEIENRGFTSICTPKIVSGNAEGGTEVFKLDYFGKEASLAQSPQFYKQMMCGVLGKVYEIAPVFRAEKHASSRHLNEYVSIDVEMPLNTGLQELIDLESSVLNELFYKLYWWIVPEGYASVLGIEVPPKNPNFLNTGAPLQLKFSEVKEILGTVGGDLTGEEEREICKYSKEKENGTDLVFVTHYPKETRPFYSKLSPDGKTTETFDLLYKGMEITSGGQRKETYKEYIEEMEARDMNPKNFESYLNTFKWGMPPHGGFAIGLERLTARILNLESVKEASLFPRDTERLVP